ncbi:NOL1/NOP2/sun family protein, partial [Toxoplasma gondii ARI]
IKDDADSRHASVACGEFSPGRREFAGASRPGTAN